MAAANRPNAAAAVRSGLRKPVFVKVEDLKPGTSGHTLTVKVVESTMVLQKGGAVSASLRNTRIAECLVGDETATVLFTARNDQGLITLPLRFPFLVDLMKAGNTVILRNAKIDMFKGCMRLAVDKWGRIEVTEPAAFEVKMDNNLSLVEYELVNVPAED
ncbi:OLC1v1023138C1 [Oldenlandia corymbosa var. corymbosa]|uniref:OLC1v1023138C1 n=1 Tax=Oldenlandia corymbosa var. corymbosa TaxID=529605 RepID=A0AAV1C0X5_OLDCO|nr:OLC1v1023138C1 [Oldenlandia corymbosa var. corymbosa]